VREWLTGILPVLACVHEKRIIHRDIKPDNVILRSRDHTHVLIDFGAVRETMGTQINVNGKSTQSIVIGTPGFTPSEQAAGRAVFGSDLYSLGLTEIYALTGKIPQELPTDPMTGEVQWRSYAPSVSAGLANVIDRAIAPGIHSRFQTSAQMLNALLVTDAPMGIPGTVLSQPSGAQAT
jgi:serine/threonine-protein kinase